MSYIHVCITLHCCGCCVAVQMGVLKALLDKFGKNMKTWLTADKRMKLLSILRDSFLCKCESDAERQHKTDILLLIELLASSFQLTNEARQIHHVS